MNWKTADYGDVRDKDKNQKTEGNGQTDGCHNEVTSEIICVSCVCFYLPYSITNNYWPRLMGSTPAKVRKSIMRKLSGVPSWVGSVGTQLGCTLR
jgi:hypothetical protein